MDYVGGQSQREKNSTHSHVVAESRRSAIVCIEIRVCRKFTDPPDLGSYWISTKIQSSAGSLISTRHRRLSAIIILLSSVATGCRQDGMTILHPGRND